MGGFFLEGVGGFRCWSIDVEKIHPIHSWMEAAPNSSLKVLLTLQKCQGDSFILFSLELLFCFLFSVCLVVFFKKKKEKRMGPNQILTWQQHNSNRWWRGGIQFASFFFFQWIFDAYVFFLFWVDACVCGFFIYMAYLSISVLSTSILYYYFISVFWAWRDSIQKTWGKLENPWGPFFLPLFKNCC